MATIKFYDENGELLPGKVEHHLTPQGKIKLLRAMLVEIIAEARDPVNGRSKMRGVIERAERLLAAIK